MKNDADPKTEELRLEQARREHAEREQAEQADTEEETEQHARRAEKSDYLRQKLDQRADAERKAG